MLPISFFKSNNHYHYVINDISYFLGLHNNFYHISYLLCNVFLYNVVNAFKVVCKELSISLLSKCALQIILPCLALSRSGQ